MTETDQELFVIGAGLMRTGTFSLRIALEILYGGPCYHMFVIFNEPYRIQLWLKALNQGYMNKDLSKLIFKGFVAAVDYPVAPFYGDLMKIYPNSKVILSVRNSKDWVKSVRNTTIRKPRFFRNIFWKIIFLAKGSTSFDDMMIKMFAKSLKIPYNVLRDDDEALEKAYNTYNDEVRRTVPKDRLLEFNAKDGWKPLCDFLNLPIPNEPYPCVNNTEEFQKNVGFLFCSGLVKIGFIIAIPVVVSFFIYRKYRSEL